MRENSIEHLQCVVERQFSVGRFEETPIKYLQVTEINRGLDFSNPPVYNLLKEGIQMQDLMPSVKTISKIEIASLTLDGVGCYFLLCRSI